MRIALVVVVLVLSLPYLQAAPSSGTPTLSPGHPSTMWQGAYFDAGATPHAAACTEVTCDAFDFRVRIPAGLAKSRPPALEVSIRWTSEQNDFDLFLYDGTGALVAESTGMVSTAEGLLLPNVPSGDYRAVVVPATVSASAYEGLAELELPESHEGDLLPNLVTLPPSGLRIVAPVYFTATPLEAGGVRPLSCAPDEAVEAGALRCLRFNNAIANHGIGPLEARFPAEGVPTGVVDEETRVILQRVYRADGSFYEREAGHYTFHALHAHFHYEGFAEHTLYSVTPEGLVQVRDGRKAGFCMVDIALDAWNAPGNGPRTYKAPVCLVPTDGTELVQGITAGWADVYTWDLPDQYVDITGLPDGCYRLETRADPFGYFVEKDPGDNAGSVDLTLEGDGVRVGC